MSTLTLFLPCAGGVEDLLADEGRGGDERYEEADQHGPIG
mgnify:CR=1 FL=1